MLSRTSHCSVVLTLFLLAATQGLVRGQRLDDGQVAFEEKSRATRLLRQDMFKGVTQADPRDKSHVEAIDIASKEVTYPLVWTTMAGRPKAGEVNRLVEEFDGRLAQMTKFRGPTLAMQQMYCRNVIDRVQEVIQNDKAKPIATVNAARILSLIPERRANRDVPVTEKEWVHDVLPRLADGNGDHLATVCVTLLDDPKTNDGARYFLFRALASLLGLPPQTPPLVKAEHAEKGFAAALKQVERKMAFPKATPSQDVEGYKMLRRQAIRVLSQARVPVIGKTRIALALARVAGNDESIVPAPRIEERVEASLGLARMGANAAKYPDLQMDYAAFQISQTVVDLGNQANANLDSRPTGRLVPWKVEAARLADALEKLKIDVKSPYVQQAADQCLRSVLLTLVGGAATTPGDVGDWLSRNEPPAKMLFRGDEVSVVTPRGDEPPETREKTKDKDKPAEPEKDKGKAKSKTKSKGK